MTNRKAKILKKLKKRLSDKLKDRLYCDPDYGDYKGEHGTHRPPDTPRYPDPKVYGDYASKKPPPYVPHPYDHTCFKPREEDYKPPTTCDDDGGTPGLCARPDHRTLTVDQQDRFLNAFSQINIMNALGPLVDDFYTFDEEPHVSMRQDDESSGAQSFMSLSVASFSSFETVP